MTTRATRVSIASATAVCVVALLVGGRSLIAQQPDGETALSPQEKHGEMLFFQRCSLCHLPPLVAPTQPARLPVGPLLYGYLDTPQNETRVRPIIENGGVLMPGFRYSLTPDDIDAVVAYMRTPEMATPPEWFVEAQARGRTRDGGGDPVD